MLGHENQVALTNGVSGVFKEKKSHSIRGQCIHDIRERTTDEEGKADPKIKKALPLDTRKSCCRYSHPMCCDIRKASSRKAEMPVFSVHGLQLFLPKKPEK